MKHTRGEWWVSGRVQTVKNNGYSYDDVSINCISGDSKGFEIARAADIWNEVEQNANARLMAAAPDLLEALQDYIANQDGDYDSKSCKHDFFCVCPSEKAKAAIAKALGTDASL